MKLAETVTFGGSALDRAAHLRGDKDALEALRAKPDTAVIIVWRGKPLFAGEGGVHLLRLAPDDARLDGLAGDEIFLGLDENGGGLFARDISAWQPESDQDQVSEAFFDPTKQHHPAFEPDQLFAELRSVMAQVNPRDAELAATAKSLMSWQRSHRFCAKCGTESEMAMAGWQRNCPACKTPHFPRTDPVVIMLITHGNSVLMGRSPGWPRGMYSLLAGFLEPGETIEAAVRREVEEESSIKVGEVSYLASQPWPYPSSLMIGCHGHALTEEIEIDPKEIEDARWFTREEVADAFAGRHPLLLPARKGAIAHFILWNWLADQLD